MTVGKFKALEIRVGFVEVCFVCIVVINVSIVPPYSSGEGAVVVASLLVLISFSSVSETGNNFFSILMNLMTLICSLLCRRVTWFECMRCPEGCRCQPQWGWSSSSWGPWC